MILPQQLHQLPHSPPRIRIQKQLQLCGPITIYVVGSTDSAPLAPLNDKTVPPWTSKVPPAARTRRSGSSVPNVSMCNRPWQQVVPPRPSKDRSVLRPSQAGPGQARHQSIACTTSMDGRSSVCGVIGLDEGVFSVLLGPVVIHCSE